MIVVLFQKQLKRPANDNNLLLCGNEGLAVAAQLRTLAGQNNLRDVAHFRQTLRSLAEMLHPRPGVIHFPREWTTMPERYAEVQS